MGNEPFDWSRLSDRELLLLTAQSVHEMKERLDNHGDRIQKMEDVRLYFSLAKHALTAGVAGVVGWVHAHVQFK